MGRKGRYAKIKARRQRIAGERISILLEQAEERALEGEMDLADRYGFMARKISMRYQVPVPRYFKARYCKACDSYLLPGTHSRYRLTGGKLTRQCLKCGTFYRLPTGKRGV